MTELIERYRNGNYVVKIYSDGTKIRFTENNYFEPQFPESIDLKITNYCYTNCDYCHENSSISGKRAYLGYDFLGELNPGTELAIGGGNPLSHPDLPDFLKYMNDLGVICNLTVHQLQLEEDFDKISDLISSNLIKGLGVSYDGFVGYFDLFSLLKSIPNLALHVVNGLVSLESLERFYDNGFKLLILGYKNLGRGVGYSNSYQSDINKNQEILKDNIKMLYTKFNVVSFDNLAIKQLDIKSTISGEDWDKYYMGDDGKFTMYIDLVKETFSESSTSSYRFKGIRNRVQDMFSLIQEVKN